MVESRAKWDTGEVNVDEYASGLVGLVCLSCDNKIAQTGGLTNRHSFFIVPDQSAGRSGS